MRVRIWNAYASNNSGSYTIVGALPSEEVAREAADELAAMIEAHTRWHAAPREANDTSKSPLAAFCRKHDLAWTTGVGEVDDWPEHSDDNRPRVTSIGHQVVVHHEYTVTLPTVFGAYFYKRGGRVQNEENHAHHPIVTTASIWWGWTKEQRAQAELELPRLIAKLTGPDGLLVHGSPRRWPAAWRIKADYMTMTVGISFEDLIEGVRALNDVVQSHGAHMHIRMHEAADEEHDPLIHLRPSSPAVPRFDIVMTNAGQDRPRLIRALTASLGLQEWEVRGPLMTLPCTVARSVPASRAEAAAAALRETGAAVDLVRNDG